MIFHTVNRFKVDFTGHEHVSDTGRFLSVVALSGFPLRSGCLSIGLAVVLDALQGEYKLHYSRHEGQ